MVFNFSLQKPASEAYKDCQRISFKMAGLMNMKYVDRLYVLDELYSGRTMPVGPFKMQILQISRCTVQSLFQKMTAHF